MKKTVGSVKSYTFGFLFSLVLTLCSFAAYWYQSETGGLSFEISVAVLMSLAVLQLVVQLIFFLHLSHEKGPRWNLIFFLSTISIFIMVVVGSIWIMYHLNYNMMPGDVGEMMMIEEGIRK